MDASPSPAATASDTVHSLPELPPVPDFSNINNPPFDRAEQSIKLVSDDQPPDETAVYRNAFLKKFGSDELLSIFDRNVTTAHENFEIAVKKYPKNLCYGSRVYNEDGSRGEYKYLTYSEIHQRIKNFSSGLAFKKVGKNDRVGIYSINRIEWDLTDIACSRMNYVSVPLYDTLGASATEFVIKDAQISVIVASKDKIPILLKCLNRCESLRIIVQLDACKQEAVDPKHAAACESHQVSLMTFTELEKLGETNPAEPCPPSPQDLYSLVYTSGTTGNPKGAMVTHQNVIAAVTGLIYAGYQPTGTDVHLSYLPLAHILERVSHAGFLSRGAAIAFFQGTISKLLEDISDVRPTFFLGVPRVFSRLFDRVWATVNSKNALTRKLFKAAYNKKANALKQVPPKSTNFLDKVMFKKTKNRLGGRVQWMVSGSAPLSPSIHTFLQIVFCCHVMQGYGLTETSTSLSIGQMGDSVPNHVGPPMVVSDVKLVDVPAMGYHASDTPFPRGEICTKGPALFKGYWNNDEKTRETIDSNGWFHTGDIGQILQNGTIQVIDRKKNIFKLSQGEYIAAEYLENVFVRSKYIRQIYIFGNSGNNFLVAVVVPDPDSILPWAGKETTTDLEKAQAEVGKILESKRDEVKKLIISDMKSYGQQSKLKGFQYIKDCVLDHEFWTVDNDLLTPTQKVRRPFVLRKYKAQLEQLYSSSA